MENASVFILRTVLHDWTDEHAVSILSRLREAASPATKLVIAEFVIPYSCADPNDSLEISGAVSEFTPPSPLLSNFGRANSIIYSLDMNVSYRHSLGAHLV